MPTLAEHPAHSVVKALIVGDSGAGKTGGIASLVDAGYKIRIIDIGQDGLDPIIGHVKDRSKLVNVEYESVKDTFKIKGTRVAIDKAPAFQQVMGLMNEWPSDKKHISEWPADTVFVLDALSSLGRASLNMVLAANGYIDRAPEIQHWGTAMDNIEKFLGNVTNQALVPCHCLVLTHITYQEDASGAATKGFPEALGSKLNPKVARYFNNMIAVSSGSTGRFFKTKRDGLIVCKTSRPIKDQYPIDTGLKDIFTDLLK